jgi:hypothetical protein
MNKMRKLDGVNDYGHKWAVMVQEQRILIIFCSIIPV